MEDTLGKRIAAHRKRLGLTQDQLAEKLSVTAQAVSKWENDQSCPDITTVPLLASIFQITTDELLGIPPLKTVQAEVVDPETAPNRPTFEFQFGDESDPNKEKGPTVGGNFEFTYDAGRKGGIALALWVLLTAGLLFLSSVRYHNAFSLWNCLWPSGLFVFGIFGLYPKFSVLRLGCALFGGYYVVNMLRGIFLNLDSGLLLPLFLLFFGLSILTESLRKKGKGRISINKPNMVNKLDIDGEHFHCATSFGEDDHVITIPRLSGGTAEVSFGDLTVDLSGCEEIASPCPLNLKCAFGELTLLIPRGCRAEWNTKKSFANLDIKGSPVPDAQTILNLSCDVSFGEITLRYL